MKKIILLLTVAGSTCMVACNDAAKTEKSSLTTKDSSTFSLSEGRAFLEKDNAKFMEEIKKGDSAALAEHYHSEGQILMANSEPVMKKDIASAWGSFIRMGVKDLKITTLDVVGGDDLLVETGSYEMVGDKNTVIDKGKYVVVWKKEDGKWKLYRDIAATSMPMPQSK